MNLTPSSSGRPKGRFAPFAPPLMSNVRPHERCSAARCRPAWLHAWLVASVSRRALDSQYSSGGQAEFAHAHKQSWLSFRVVAVSRFAELSALAAAHPRRVGGICPSPSARAGMELVLRSRGANSTSVWDPRLVSRLAGSATASNGATTISAMAPNPSIERTSQRPLRALCAAAHVKR